MSERPSAAASGGALRVAVAGASGRMGRMLIDAISQTHDLTLAAAIDLPTSPAIGTPAAAFLGHREGVKVTADVHAALSHAQVLIDFTQPEGTLAHLRVCRELGVRAVVGTTGFSAAQKVEIAALADEIAIVMAPNMSVGVNVVLGLLDTAARLLGDGFDIEVIEAHHRHKVDAPSGTALAMGEVLAKARSRVLEDCAVYARDGFSAPGGGARRPATIGFSSIRGGDIVGDHTVLFAGTGERIEITHRSSSRATYAEGSLRAVRFLVRHKAGLFDMSDVLGITRDPPASSH